MPRTAIDIFNSILSEADKIEKALSALEDLPRPAYDISGNVSVSLLCLEQAVEILAKNTDVKTNELNPVVLAGVPHEEIAIQLERIGTLARKIEIALMVNQSD
jgi:hypothetical protein